ncbi:hypothetical protein FS837_003264 [Tulasnella sp. UAMH 9824]|nr:hypothetical protein FS837_003264 [Tulasnella sp. UAMH 9824]
MPTNPRSLKLKIERLKRDAASGMKEMLNVIGQAEEMARSLPPEKTCNNNTWKDLRASELLEELIVMTTLFTEALDKPRIAEVRWVFGCIGALYHAFRVMDMKPDGAAEQGLAERCPLMVSTYAKWFGSSSEDWPGLPESRRHLVLLVYRLCAPGHVEGAAPDEIDESSSMDFDEMTQVLIPSVFDPVQLQGQPPLPKNVLWAGCHILSTYGKIKGFANTTAEGFVKKYGADYMAKCCAAMIESTPALAHLLVHVSSVIQYLLFAPACHHSIVHSWRLHLRLMKKWWEVERAASKRQVAAGVDYFIFFSDIGA